MNLARRGAVGARADSAMARYACGEEAAFADLYDELAPRLHRYARRWTRSASAVEDAVQQTFLQIHTARGRFVRGAAVLPWAYAILRRLLLDLGRRDDREELRAHGVHDPDERDTELFPDEALHWRRVEAEAQRDLRLLPSAWREAFELVKFEGLSVAETAEVLGITRGMVKIRTHRATAALRKAMAKRLRDPAARPHPPARGAPPAAALIAIGVPTCCDPSRRGIGSWRPCGTTLRRAGPAASSSPRSGLPALPP